MRRDDLVSDEVSLRVIQIDTAALESDLGTQGWSILPHLLTLPQCDAIADMYDKDGGFRSRVVMARHGFGRGEYRYFSYPLPPMIQGLRTTLKVVNLS